MKKVFYILILMIIFTGCDSVTLRGGHGSLHIRDSYNYRRSRSRGNAFGHKKYKKQNRYYYYYPYHPHHNIGVSGKIYIDF